MEQYIKKEKSEKQRRISERRTMLKGVVKKATIIAN